MALGAAARTARLRGDWRRLEPVVLGLEAQGLEPVGLAGQDAWHTTRCLYLYGEQRWTEALEACESVRPEAPREHLTSLMVQGAIHASRGKLKSGVRAWRDACQLGAALLEEALARRDGAGELAAEGLSEAWLGQLCDRAVLNIGRVYYGLERFGEAELYARMVSLDSPLAEEARVQASWSQVSSRPAPVREGGIKAPERNLVGWDWEMTDPVAYTQQVAEAATPSRRRARLVRRGRGEEVRWPAEEPELGVVLAIWGVLWGEDAEPWGEVEEAEEALLARLQVTRRSQEAMGAGASEESARAELRRLMGPTRFAEGAEGAMARRLAHQTDLLAPVELAEALEAELGALPEGWPLTQRMQVEALARVDLDEALARGSLALARALDAEERRLLALDLQLQVFEAELLYQARPEETRWPAERPLPPALLRAELVQPPACSVPLDWGAEGAPRVEAWTGARLSLERWEALLAHPGLSPEVEAELRWRIAALAEDEAWVALKLRLVCLEAVAARCATDAACWARLDPEDHSTPRLVRAGRAWQAFARLEPGTPRAREATYRTAALAYELGELDLAEAIAHELRDAHVEDAWEYAAGELLEALPAARLELDRQEAWPRPGP